MRQLRYLTAQVVAWGFALLAVAPASATTIVVAFLPAAVSRGGTILSAPVTQLDAANAYEFTFRGRNPPAGGGGDVARVDLGARANDAEQSLQYQLFSGAPGSGTLIAQSTDDFGPHLTFNPSRGAYYLEITPAQIAVSGEVLTGSVTTSAVPEPGTWVLLFGGFGALGLHLRRGRPPLVLRV